MKYEILEHPAELRIRVYGKTLEELFSNAALAMAEILTKESKIKNYESEAKEKIQIQSVDLNSLMVDFLNEILAKSQINKAVYNVKQIKISPEPVEGLPYLEAKLIGYPIEKFNEDIKAVTYEDLDIKKVDDYWQTMIVFDI